MRSKFTTQMIAVVLMATLGLTGCKNFRWPWQSRSGTSGAGTTVEPLGPGTEIGGGSRPMITGDENLERGLFQPVQFAYDSASINKSTQIDALKAVAEGLKTNSKPLLIEGHADERGTAEYNRALGEKRALACREYLVRKLGVSSGRITTISYGKERPADTGHNEAAWAKNRRCEFALVGK